MIKKTLFKIARSSISSIFIGFTFEYLSALLPLKRLFEDANVIAFDHPVPSWTFHCLSVPKRRIPSFLKFDFQDANGEEILISILYSLQTIALSSRLSSYKIIVNGGRYQDVPQVHFHLCNGININSDEIKSPHFFPTKIEIPEDTLETALLYLHTQPSRSIHYVIASKDNIPSFNDIDFSSLSQRKVVFDIFLLAQKTLRKKDLDAYSLIIDVAPEKSALCIHLVSGARK